MARCKANTKAGNQCKGTATSKGGFCNVHDPAKKDAFKRGRMKGAKSGKIATLSSPTPWRGSEGDVEVMNTPSPYDVIHLLADTIDQVRVGEIDPRVANSVGYLAGIMMKVQEAQITEERLQAIEAVLGGRDA